MSEIPESLNTPEFLEAWKEWEQYKKEKRKKLPPTTIRRQLKKLAKAGPDEAVKIIEQSIEQNWTGLFEVKNDGTISKGTGKVAKARSSGFTPGVRVDA